jgi:hypothetical protein
MGRYGSRRNALVDFAIVFAGGLTAGAAGLWWLVGTGTWPHFMDVWRNWNAAYAAIIRDEFFFRLVKQQFGYFPPYSIFAVLAVPLAVNNLKDRTSGDVVRFRRAVLAGVYLTWLLTTLIFQRGYHYTHVPETFLMLAVFAANRWPAPFAILAIHVVSSIALYLPDPSLGLREAHERTRGTIWVYRQLVRPSPAFDPDRAKWWTGCFASDPPRELRRGVALWWTHFGGHDPVQLGAVADYLRAQNVKDGEVIAWHDSPHELYLELGIKPSFRFMHVSTASSIGPAQREEIRKELLALLAQGHAHFAVSDMYRITDERAPLATPEWEKLLPEWQRSEFPFNQPIVFRSPNGRYIVHAIRNPTTSCEIPRRTDQKKREE